MSQVYSSLHFARIVADCRSIGNMSPFMNNIDPSLDLRSKFDNDFNIKLAEWHGYYPLSVRSGNRNECSQQ
jgi:hypothetical protein